MPITVSQEVFTLGHLADAYLAHVQVMVQAGINEPSTRVWYANQFKHFASLRDQAAASIRTHHLAEIKLTNAFARTLKRLFKWGAAEELVPRDPFVKLTVPPCGARERVLSRPELCRLYLASPRALRRLLFVQMRTIARPGEIRTLTRGQIQFDERLILLGKFKGKKKRRDKLKVRSIPLSLPVRRLLLNMLRKAHDTSPESKVFRAPRYGKPWTYNAVRCAMRRARLKAGLDDGGERVVCYTLRHTEATNMIEADEPPSLKVLAEVMGHTRTSTTERYLHLNTNHIVDAMDKAARSRSRSPRPLATDPPTASS